MSVLMEALMYERLDCGISLVTSVVDRQPIH